MDYTQIMLSKKSTNKQADLERTSIVTATLVDVVSEWNLIKIYE